MPSPLVGLGMNLAYQKKGLTNKKPFKIKHLRAEALRM
jgi:hypothetical protein